MGFNPAQIYKTQLEIVTEMLDNLTNIIPDAYTGDDGQYSLLFNIIAGQVENLLLANQLLLDDMFIQTASSGALQRHGDEEGLSIKAGVKATGELTFIGDGGTYVPIGTEVSTNPNLSTLLYYITTEDGTIPNPGIPDAPTAAVGAATGMTGAYDYSVSFVTAAGETTSSAFSSLVNVTNQKINLTAIPLGGTGTTSRKIYRRKAGVLQGRVTTVSDNTTTVYTDSTADGSVTVADLPAASTANRILLDAVAEEVGSIYNVATGSITQLTDAPSGLTTVSNATDFGSSALGYTSGEDQEDIAAYRARLLLFKQAPKTGSKLDLENWAREINGVDSATAFPNYNGTTPQAGHTTVRIAALNGAVPSASIVTQVQAFLDSFELANLQVHVTTFTPKTVNASVTVTLASGYILGDVSASVQTVIKDYINSVPPNGSVYQAGIYDAVFGKVTGVLTLVVNSPADTTTLTTEKAVAGTVTVA